MKNTFINQFSENIKFHYTSFDRVIIRRYVLKLFSSACVVLFLKAMGFSRSTNGIMRIFTDQLNSHVSGQSEILGAPVHWWPSEDGGVNGHQLSGDCMITTPASNTGSGEMPSNSTIT